MKSLITSLIGDYFLIRLKDFIKNWMPTNNQKIELVREKEHSQRITKLYKGFVNTGDLCFDVGANIGNRIDPLLQLNAKIVAFEPQKHCSRYLKYKFKDKIEIVTDGLGKAEGVEKFYISNSSTLSTFSSDWIKTVQKQRFKGHSWNKVVDINMTTLDKMIEKYGTPTFIKIDVEGYELDVLKGLSKPIDMISFEYTVPEQINRIIECIDQIQANRIPIECNYSVSENMRFEMSSWLSADSMKQYILSPEFIKTDFGDIYVRLKH